MYPWYRDSVSGQLAGVGVGQFCSPMTATIKTETGYNDCMLALDYAAQTKKGAFVWGGDGGGNQSAAGTPGPGASPAAGCSPAAGASHTSHAPSQGTQPSQGQNPTQGLVHWMSVMAEHMTTNSHHDPAAVHYMWNGGVDQCGQHVKDMDYSGWPGPRNSMSMKQGYEAKMNASDHQHINLQKGHMDDGRMDGHHGQGGLGPALYGGAPGRSGSSNSSSPAGGALLVVPQPINASKMAGQPGLPNGATGRKYQCKMCPQIFGSKADLQLHTQIHMREAKPYKCSQCSKSFANSSYLSQHTRIHLGIKPYRCEICQRKFTQLSHLQQHIRTHTGDKPYKCRHPGCQKAFSQLSNLQSHSRCHQTDKPYKCNSCYKCFSDEPSLLEHIPKHKESKHLKTHICQYCGKSYTQETYLTKHMQKHAERTDKRPPITGLGPGGHRGHHGLGSDGPPLPGGDHPYWPKVSPDSAAGLAEAMQQHEFAQQHPGPEHHLQHHRGLLDHHHHHHRMNGDASDELAAARQHSLGLGGHPHVGHGSQGDPPAPPSTPVASAPPNSAFTPINSMAPHLNPLNSHLNHHQLSQRPYLYDTIGFQKQSGPQNPGGNAFPNQLISLHQIRNYAHQPGPGLMGSDHLLGVGVGVPMKDKAQ